MTAQVSSSFELDHEHYVIAGVCGEGLYEPVDHGFIPFSADTGCWSGYVCGYGLQGQQLVLKDLSINHHLLKAIAPPLVNGREPEPSETHTRFLFNYKNVDLPLSFEGGLLIARDFIHELYVHMGFHPAWKYRHVLELEFVEGHLVKQTDVSTRLNEFRQQFVNKNDPPTLYEQEGHDAWIRDTFSLKYRA